VCHRYDDVFEVIYMLRHIQNHSEDLGVGGKIILEWILEKYGGKMWTGFRIGTSGVPL